MVVVVVAVSGSIVVAAVASFVVVVSDVVAVFISDAVTVVSDEATFGTDQFLHYDEVQVIGILLVVNVKVVADYVDVTDHFLQLDWEIVLSKLMI
jgi:hypothetical protein